MASANCAKVGCNLPVYVEPRTKIAHRFCGRTHAQEASHNLQTPHGNCHRCNFRGCSKQVAFDSSTGRVHDFCSKEHADRAIASGEWIKPNRYLNLGDGGGDKKKSMGPMCRFPNCKLPVFTDPTTSRKHDYCGRSHAVEHRLMQARVSHVSTSTTTTAVMASAASANAAAATSTNAFDLVPPNAHRMIGGFSRVASTFPASVTATEEILDERKPAAVPLPKCAICLAMNASVILIPCGHVCLCKDDAERLRRNQQLLSCPICRRAVSSTNEVFLNH